MISLKILWERGDIKQRCVQVTMQGVLTIVFNPRQHLLFCHPRPQGGWGATPSPPPARLSRVVTEIELRNKDKRKDRDAGNLTIPDFTTLSHILIFPGQVKNVAFWGRSSFLANNF